MMLGKVGETSPLRVLTSTKANRRRKLMLSPGFVNYPDSSTILAYTLWMTSGLPVIREWLRFDSHNPNYIRPIFCLMAASKRSLHVRKQFAFDQSRRDCRAIELYEWRSFRPLRFWMARDFLPIPFDIPLYPQDDDVQ
jgi:hypothetical protein